MKPTRIKTYREGKQERVSLSDKQLVAEAKAGNHQAFEKLVERHEDKVYGLALRMMGNEADAEDVLQDTFLSAYKALKNFKEKAAFSTWLYRLATNAALMKLRKKKGDKTIPLDEQMAEFVPNPEIRDWSATPDSILEGKELKEIMEQAIQSLPDMYRAVFLLKDVERLRVHEIASILNISVPAVKSRLHRARLHLRKRIGQYLAGEPAS
jgi:RNA polymerase sigma-70 factor (ECF subfamily)